MEKEVDRDLPLKKEISRNLQRLMAERGWKQKDVVERSGIKRSTFSDYINCKTLINPGNVEKLSEVFNVPKYEIDPSFKTQLHVNESITNYKALNSYHYFPVAVSAGLPIEIESIKEAEIITIPDELLGKWAGDKSIYFTRVNGDSMNNVMEDGALIVVKPVELSQLKNGDIVVYCYDGEYAVKRFYKQDNKLIFRPDSDDMSFTDLVIDLEHNDLDIKIKGKVVLYIVELD